jgi:hypothetical protein
MMRLRTALAVLALVLAPSTGRAEGFLGIMEDLPLMPGLTEATDAAVVFDTAVGRIAETQASGGVKTAEVADFYAATLPQLGWILQGDGRYRRGGDVLRLYLTPTPDGGTAVRFAVSPADDGTKTKNKK